jgi:hypothetical protein
MLLNSRGWWISACFSFDDTQEMRRNSLLWHPYFETQGHEGFSSFACRKISLDLSRWASQQSRYDSLWFCMRLLWHVGLRATGDWLWS